MKITTIRGSCNAYLIDDLLIDAPAEVKFPEGIEKIVLTHEHCDHIAGITNLNGKIYASEFAMKSVIQKNDGACLCSYLKMNFPKIEKSTVVREGDEIVTDGLNLTVIETPGHCKGALCFYEPDEKILFAGDTVFPDNSIPRTDLPTSDIKELIKTYEKLSELGVETIYPGHGKVIKEKKYIEKVAGLI